MVISKGVLLNLLEKLLPYRSDAAGWSSFVESDYCSEENIQRIAGGILKAYRIALHKVSIKKKQIYVARTSAQHEKDRDEAELLLQKYTTCQNN